MLISKSKSYNRILCHFECGKGFTMVEVIVALAILSTSMLAVFGTLRMCVAANSNCQRRTEAVLLANSLLSGVTLSQENFNYKTETGNKGPFTWEIQTAPTGMDNLAAISVKVLWLDRQVFQEYRLYSLMHLPRLMEGL